MREFVDRFISQCYIIGGMHLLEHILVRIIILLSILTCGTGIRCTQYHRTGIHIDCLKIFFGYGIQIFPIAAASINGTVLFHTPIVESKHLSVTIHIEVCTQVCAAGCITTIIHAKTSYKSLNIRTIHDIRSRTAFTRTIHMRLYLPEFPDMIVINGITGSQSFCLLTGIQCMGHIAIPAAQFPVARSTQSHSLSVDIRKIIRFSGHDRLEVIKRLKTGYQGIGHGYRFVKLGKYFGSFSRVNVIVARTTRIIPFFTDSGATFIVNVLRVFNIRSPNRMPEESDIMHTPVCTEGFITIIQCTTCRLFI